jgi:nucleoside-diphosphate-sugar epimerase
LGRHLLAGLVAADLRVRAVDRKPLQEVYDGHLEAVQVDLERDDLLPLLDRASVVFHLAAVPGVRRSWGDSFGSYVAANLIGTQRLLEACDRSRVRRLVVASSSSVYGQAEHLPTPEDAATRPMSPYGVSKLAAEQLALAYARRPGAGTSVLALRYFTLYGPGQRPDMLVGRLLGAAVTGVAAPLYGDGSQARDFTFVEDAVAATMAAAGDVGRAEVINVGTGASTSVLQLVALVEEATGRPVPLRPAGGQAGDVDRTQACIARAKRLLGYRPQVDLRAGLARQLQSLEQPIAPPLGGTAGAVAVGIPEVGQRW